MRQIGELLKELGFDSEAPIGTQKAFIRHLIRAAAETEAVRSQPSLLAALPAEQLSFDPVVLGILPSEPAILKLKRSR